MESRSHGSYPPLERRVVDRHAAGVDTVPEYEGLRVNPSNADPRLGHCTVVACPAAPAFPTRRGDAASSGPFDQIRVRS